MLLLLTISPLSSRVAADPSRLTVLSPTPSGHFCASHPECDVVLQVTPDKATVSIEADVCASPHMREQVDVWVKPNVWRRHLRTRRATRNLTHGLRMPWCSTRSTGDWSRRASRTMRGRDDLESCMTNCRCMYLQALQHLAEHEEV